MGERERERAREREREGERRERDERARENGKLDYVGDPGRQSGSGTRAVNRDYRLTAVSCCISGTENHLQLYPAERCGALSANKSDKSSDVAKVCLWY